MKLSPFDPNAVISTSEQAVKRLAEIEVRLAEVSEDLEKLKGPACCRCGDSDMANDVQLLGGYETCLCRACRNAWVHMINESGLYLQHARAHARKLFASRDENGLALDACLDATSELVAVEIKLFETGRRWVSDVVSSP